MTIFFRSAAIFLTACFVVEPQVASALVLRTASRSTGADLPVVRQQALTSVALWFTRARSKSGYEALAAAGALAIRSLRHRPRFTLTLGNEYGMVTLDDSMDRGRKGIQKKVIFQRSLQQTADAYVNFINSVASEAPDDGQEFSSRLRRTLSLISRRDAKDSKGIERAIASAFNVHSWARVESILNRYLFLPRGGYYVGAHGEGLWRSCITPLREWQWSPVGENLWIVLTEAGEFTGFEFETGLIKINAQKILDGAQGNEWVVDVTWNHILEEVGHATDWRNFNDREKKVKALHELVVPDSELEDYVRSNPSTDLRNDLSELAAAYREVIHATHPNTILVSVVAAFSHSSSRADRSHDWALNFMRGEFRHVLNLDENLVSQEPSKRLKHVADRLQELGGETVKLIFYARMALNLRLPRDGNDPGGQGLPIFLDFESLAETAFGMLVSEFTNVIEESLALGQLRFRNLERELPLETSRARLEAAIEKAPEPLFGMLRRHVQERDGRVLLASFQRELGEVTRFQLLQWLQKYFGVSFKIDERGTLTFEGPYEAVFDTGFPVVGGHSEPSDRQQLEDLQTRVRQMLIEMQGPARFLGQDDFMRLRDFTRANYRGKSPDLAKMRAIIEKAEARQDRWIKAPTFEDMPSDGRVFVHWVLQGKLLHLKLTGTQWRKFVKRAAPTRELNPDFAEDFREWEPYRLQPSSNPDQAIADIEHLLKAEAQARRNQKGMSLMSTMVIAGMTAVVLAAILGSETAAPAMVIVGLCAAIVMIVVKFVAFHPGVPSKKAYEVLANAGAIVKNLVGLRHRIPLGNEAGMLGDGGFDRPRKPKQSSANAPLNNFWGFRRINQQEAAELKPLYEKYDEAQQEYLRLLEPLRPLLIKLQRSNVFTQLSDDLFVHCMENEGTEIEVYPESIPGTEVPVEDAPRLMVLILGRHPELRELADAAPEALWQKVYGLKKAKWEISDEIHQAIHRRNMRPVPNFFSVDPQYGRSPINLTEWLVLGAYPQGLHGKVKELWQSLPPIEGPSEKVLWSLFDLIGQVDTTALAARLEGQKEGRVRRFLLLEAAEPMILHSDELPQVVRLFLRSIVIAFFFQTGSRVEHFGEAGVLEINGQDLLEKLRHRVAIGNLETAEAVLLSSNVTLRERMAAMMDWEEQLPSQIALMAGASRFVATVFVRLQETPGVQSFFKRHEKPDFLSVFLKWSSSDALATFLSDHAERLRALSVLEEADAYREALLAAAAELMNYRDKVIEAFGTPGPTPPDPSNEGQSFAVVAVVIGLVMSVLVGLLSEERIAPLVVFAGLGAAAAMILVTVLRSNRPIPPAIIGRTPCPLLHQA